MSTSYRSIEITLKNIYKLYAMLNSH